MARKTVQNSITSPELLSKVNPENKRLVEDYISYLRSVRRAETTIRGYQNDLDIFFCWNVLHNRNKFFTDITKRDIIAYQNFLLNEHKNSPARVRRLKATLSSLSNYIENILDDEYPNFRSIVKKIENPVNQAVREKTVFTDEQLQDLLDALVEKGEYQKACALAIAKYSGSRKSEIPRFKVEYFTDENIVFGSLYKTPEKVKTKGRGDGKYIHRYVLSREFQPYLDLWLKQREELGIDSEWLFVSKSDGGYIQLKTTALNSWAKTFSRISKTDFYWHSLRHFFTTKLVTLGLPDTVIQDIVGWADTAMVRHYDDTDSDDRIGSYFNEDGIIQKKPTVLSDL